MRKVEWMPFEEAREFVRRLGLKTRAEWDAYCRSGNKPSNIPVNVVQYYKGKGWVSWGDWLGTGFVAGRNRKYWPYDQSMLFVRALGLKSSDEWALYTKSGNKPKEIPAYPREVYENKGWISVGHWLGTGIVAPQDREYWTYDKSISFVHQLGLNSSKEWGIYAKSGNKPSEIPSNPRQVYKNSGWISMGHWLGTGVIAPQNKKYWPYDKSMIFVHELGLNSQSEWNSYARSGNKPEEIPSNPRSVYDGRGWVSVGHWLGTGTIAPQKKMYWTHDQSMIFVHRLKLNSKSEWTIFSKSHNKPQELPANPVLVYKNNGWKSWGHWLGTGTIAPQNKVYWTHNQSMAFVHGLELKSGEEWISYTKSGIKPSEIPSDPRQVYKNSGWISMGHWLGTGTIAAQNREYWSYDVAMFFVHGLKLTGEAAWRAYSKSHNKPRELPANPALVYKNNGWESWGHWLGTGIIANRYKMFATYDEFRLRICLERANGRRLNSKSDYVIWTKDLNFPADIPKNPSQYYSNNP